MAVCFQFASRLAETPCPGVARKGIGAFAAVAFAKVALASLLCAPAAAASLQVAIDDGTLPLQNAVASLHSESARAAVASAEARMGQRDGQFEPRVLPITVGTRVSFPNQDRIRHHVYSFSPAKRFELPLYAGHTASPVVFDLPGVAVLGCNIHDWMIAYVVVLDTPFFSRSGDDGRALLHAPAGRYTLRVWHEALGPGSAPLEREVVIAAGADLAREQVSLDLIDRAPNLAPSAPGPGPEAGSDERGI